MSPSPDDHPPSTATPPPTVEWRYDATTSRWLRGVALVRAALLGGATVVVFTVLAVLVSLLVASADATLAGVALLVVALRLFGDPNTLALVTGDDRLAIVPRQYRRPRLSRRQRRLVAVPGALVLLAAAWLSPPLVLVPLVVGLAALAVLEAFSTAGRLDAAERRYLSEPGAVEWSFAGLSGYTTRRLGPVVVFRLRYPRRPGRLSKLQRVWVPTARAPDAAALFDAVVASSPSSDAPATDGRSSNRTVTLVAGVMALGILVGSTLAVVELGGVLGWYFAAIGGTFGLLLLAVAVFEG
ncbi:hypothetical protein [Halomarina rubra]|uniref:PH domain-containing protein n=1 Tax=Halomarina rubra TaxID=2071873 RepID=A0ABD6AUB2_9EURY|nr:hypothetical protein [Halomarina rubra]